VQIPTPHPIDRALIERVKEIARRHVDEHRGGIRAMLSVLLVLPRRTQAPAGVWGIEEGEKLVADMPLRCRASPSRKHGEQLFERRHDIRAGLMTGWCAHL
jgi:hypothetical protein